VWQRSYHDRIIRNEEELLRIQQYIAENPIKWALDKENPDAH
jgi:REP element-mobilizing transposase RayT